MSNRLAYGFGATPPRMIGGPGPIMQGGASSVATARVENDEQRAWQRESWKQAQDSFSKLSNNTPANITVKDL